MNAEIASKDELFQEIKNLLVDRFELNAKHVVPAAHIYNDLDLDSIDAVDVLIFLQKKTGKKVKPEDFKTVRTVDDMVEAAYKVIHGL